MSLIIIIEAFKADSNQKEMLILINPLVKFQWDEKKNHLDLIMSRVSENLKEATH